MSHVLQYGQLKNLNISIFWYFDICSTTIRMQKGKRWGCFCVSRVRLYQNDVFLTVPPNFLAPKWKSYIKMGGGFEKPPFSWFTPIFAMAELSAKIKPSQVRRVGFKANFCQRAGWWRSTTRKVTANSKYIEIIWNLTLALYLVFRQVQLLPTFKRGALVQVCQARHRLYDGQ